MNDSRNSLLKRYFLEQEEEEEEKVSEKEEDDDDGKMTIDTIDDYADEEEEGEDDSYEEDEDYDQEDSVAPTGGNGSIGINVSLQTFGMDDSPVQNQFNPKEIERLNTLIASENSAIGEYFQASKETNVDILRRLYSDIGEEERFHSEQLLFAKSQLTGEPYVPRDPDVKKEYEELLSLGMDEETAMTTAVDRVGLMSKSDTQSPEETIQSMECVIDAIEDVQRTIYQEYMIICMEEASKNFSMKERDNAIQTYVEAYTEGLFGTPEYFLEDAVNATELPGKKQKIADISVSGCFKFVKVIINAIRHLAHNIAIWATNQRQHLKAKMQWLKRHPLSDIFKSGLNLYFYSETGSFTGFDLSDAVKYMGRLYRCAKAVGEVAGVKVKEIQYKNTEKKASDNFIISANNIDEAIENIRHVSLSKTKLVLNEQTKQAFIKEDVFGISGGTNGSPEKSNQSGFYNRYNALLGDFNNVMEGIKGVLEGLNNLSQNKQSIFYSDKDKYNKCVKYINYVIKGCQMFINALTHDLNALAKGNQDLVALATSAPKAQPTAQNNEVAQPGRQKDAAKTGGNTVNKQPTEPKEQPPQQPTSEQRPTPEQPQQDQNDEPQNNTPTLKQLKQESSSIISVYQKTLERLKQRSFKAPPDAATIKTHLANVEKRIATIERLLRGFGSLGYQVTVEHYVVTESFFGPSVKKQIQQLEELLAGFKQYRESLIAANSNLPREAKPQPTQQPTQQPSPEIDYSFVRDFFNGSDTATEQVDPLFGYFK